MAEKTGKIRIGIGGWTYDSWRGGAFYPEGHPKTRELAYASEHLTSIEVNGTFYRSQKPETFAKWRDETPDGFVFALKAPRYATNRKVLAEAGESVERFITGGITELGDKLGPINWQFAATKKFDPEDFEAFLKLLPASHDGHTLRHALEVRHDSFCTPDFVAMARAYGVAVIVAGDAKYPQIADPTAPFIYARIMGTAEAEPLGYSDAGLDRWAARARAWAAGQTPEDLTRHGAVDDKTKARDVYLYVISGFKERNPAAAMALIERIGRA